MSPRRVASIVVVIPSYLTQREPAWPAHTPLAPASQFYGSAKSSDSFGLACSLLRCTTGAVIPVDGGRPLN